MPSRQVPSRFTCPPQGSDPCCNQPLHPCLHRQIFFTSKIPSCACAPPKVSHAAKVTVCLKITRPSSRVSRGRQQQRCTRAHPCRLLRRAGAPPAPRCLHRVELMQLRPNQRLDSLPPTSRTCATPTALLQGAPLPALLLFLKPLTCLPFTPHSQRKCTKRETGRAATGD